MAQVKMKYGIDLGTTNSSICIIENGTPRIQKTDQLKDTLPSCVSFTKKKMIRVGDGAYADLRSDRSRGAKKWSKQQQNVFIEFKRNMGLDTQFVSSNMERSFSAEELSSEVLKTLKSFVSDDEISAAVITIPAKFKADQIAATKRAATMAGITQCELLQEPIAASMAYGMSTADKDGMWLVFDFGGGTFDAALVKVEDGIMRIPDTEGDNNLGGKNLDYAIVDSVIIPYLQKEYSIDGILADPNKKEILRDAMKFYAEQAKNQLSFKPSHDITSQMDEFGEDDEGTPIDLDLIITQEQIREPITPLFQKAIDLCKKLLQRNHLKGDQLTKLILVGGPTHSPVLREMLREQITQNVDTSIDPMTAVATGAALYAAGIGYEAKPLASKEGVVALDVSYEASSVEPVEFVTIKLLPAECTGTIPEKVVVEIVRSDEGWSSGRFEIDDVGDVIECHLMEGKSNSFTIHCYDAQGNTLKCFPNEINIMSGFVVGSAVLPYNIGIEASNEELNRDVFVPLKGLEKNQPIPAVGVGNGFKTSKQLRPGISEDRLVIPIYQGEFNAEDSSAIYNDHVFDVVITGDDVPALIPEASDINITIKVDRSQQMTLEADFPVIGESVEMPINVGQRHAIEEYELKQRLDEGKRKLNALNRSSAITADEMEESKKLLNDVVGRFEAEKGSEDGRTHLLDDLRRAFLEMEKVEKVHEWDSIEAELREEFDRLEKANDDLGHEYDNEVEELRTQTDQAIRERDPHVGRTVLRQIRRTFIDVTRIYQLMNFIEHFDKVFGSTSWKDSNRARNLLNKGLEIISTDPSVRKLQPVVNEVWDLINWPRGEKPKKPF